MNIQKLRHSLKEKWLTYYCENREWLVQLSIWVICDGQNRPSASFILATLTTLEPQLTRLMPLLSGLNSSPDRIVSALGLNFNPDDMAEHWLREQQNASHPVLLPSNGEVLDVAFHPEAMLVGLTITVDQQDQQNHADLNGSQDYLVPSNVNPSNVNPSNVNPSTKNNRKDGSPNALAGQCKAHIAPPTPQMIARQDEQCTGRDHDGHNNIWR